jgi:hypothetical protein
MFRAVLSRWTDLTNHPLLTALLLLSAVFLAVGIYAETFMGELTFAGFMGVYAVLAAFMGGLGYALLGLSKGVSRLRRQFELF